MPILGDRQGHSSTIAASCKLDRADFVEAFANCFRGGAVLAERAFDTAPSVVVDCVSVFSALRAQFRAATDVEKMEMLKAYTPLDPGIIAARIVADESQSDGLRAMTADQQRRLIELLVRYAEKFGFDAIFVVRDYTTSDLLASLEARLVADFEAEMMTVYYEVERLAEIQVEAYFAARHL